MANLEFINRIECPVVVPFIIKGLITLSQFWKI